MSPREILKEIRQIELPRNRLVTEFADGARASARFTARTPASPKTDPPPDPVRPLKRRERGAPMFPAQRLPASIPKGLCPPAQGCEVRATLGQRPTSMINRNAVAAISFSSAARGICHNPVGVGDDLIPFTQGSSCVATLGCMTQSRWDCPNRLKAEICTASAAHLPSRITPTPRIPRKLLSRIRQIEPRTNYPALRLGLRPQPRSVSACPEGCQKLAGGRSASADPRYAARPDTTLKGSQHRSLKSLRPILAPLQGAAFCSSRFGGIVAPGAPQPPANVSHAFSVTARVHTPPRIARRTAGVQPHSRMK